MLTLEPIIGFEDYFGISAYNLLVYYRKMVDCKNAPPCTSPPPTMAADGDISGIGVCTHCTSFPNAA